MVSLKSAAAALVAVFTLSGIGTQVQAQEEVVTVTAKRTQEQSAAIPACAGLSASDSGRLAREAEKEGAWQRASECFVASGEYTRAHRASVHAASEAAAARKHSASTAADSAKTQIARLRAAFR